MFFFSPLEVFVKINMFHLVSSIVFAEDVCVSRYCLFHQAKVITETYFHIVLVL